MVGLVCSFVTSLFLQEAVTDCSLVRKVHELRTFWEFVLLTYWQVFMTVGAVLYVLDSKPNERTE
jgi:hypothetical protein